MRRYISKSKLEQCAKCIDGGLKHDFDPSCFHSMYPRTEMENGLYATNDFADASDVMRYKVCNGVGSRVGTMGKITYHLIPETIYGLNIRACANVHDWDYCFLPRNDKSKEDADRQFLANIYIKINKGSWWLRFVRRRRAWLYYWAVRYLGRESYYN